MTAGAHARYETELRRSKVRRGAGMRRASPICSGRCRAGRRVMGRQFQELIGFSVKLAFCPHAHAHALISGSRSPTVANRDLLLTAETVSRRRRAVLEQGNRAERRSRDARPQNCRAKPSKPTPRSLARRARSRWSGWWWSWRTSNWCPSTRFLRTGLPGTNSKGSGSGRFTSA